MPVKDASVYPIGAMIEVEIDGRRIVFDMADGYNFDFARVDTYLATCDAWFKRSFSREMNARFSHGDKIFPLGFNYQISHRAAPQPALTRLKNAIKAALPGYSPEYAHATFDKFEAPPQTTDPPRILFSARLWPPDLNDAELNREREQINATRIEIIRKLKREYGTLFTGGLYDMPFAREQAPDLILPAEHTDRNAYLQTVKDCDICIASMGLHRSIGWKMGEYVAASRAIVTEKMHYEVPGGYTEGRHYLSFDTVAECLAHIDTLVNDRERRHEIMCANHAYYNEYLRPDKLVGNALRKFL
jgi:hypothetical protein